MPALAALDRSERFCREIRAAVGDAADLLFGTHGQFTAAGALRLAQRLEPYDPLWFEEPCPPEEMAKVAAGTRIPVATGERLCSKFEFARVLDHGAAAILQPDLGRAGGILEGKKIAAMAETRYVQIAPHLYCGPIVAAANIQLAACTPNFLILESIGRMDGFHADLLKTPLCWENGHILPPTAPGLGVELNDDVVAAHPWQGDRLHLEMGDARTTRGDTDPSRRLIPTSGHRHIRLKSQCYGAIAVLTRVHRGVYSSAIRFGVPERYVFAFRPPGYRQLTRLDRAAVPEARQTAPAGERTERTRRKPCMRW